MFSTTKKNLVKPSARKTKKQLGGGWATTTPKTYTNLTYKKSGFNISQLQCLQCKNNVFRHHTATYSSRLRSFITDTDVLGNKYNIFVCYKCGFMMNYSGDISYSGRDSPKSRKSE